MELLERGQLACHPPCQSEPSPTAERGGRHPWRPGSHSSGGGPSPPAAPVPLEHSYIFFGCVLLGCALPPTFKLLVCELLRPEELRCRLPDAVCVVSYFNLVLSKHPHKKLNLYLLCHRLGPRLWFARTTASWRLCVGQRLAHVLLFLAKPPNKRNQRNKTTGRPHLESRRVSGLCKVILSSSSTLCAVFTQLFTQAFLQDGEVAWWFGVGLWSATLDLRGDVIAYQGVGRRQRS